MIHNGVCHVLCGDDMLERFSLPVNTPRNEDYYYAYKCPGIQYILLTPYKFHIIILGTVGLHDRIGGSGQLK